MKARITSVLLLIAFLLYGCSSSARISPQTIKHPDNSSATIEFFVEHPPGRGPWPTIIFLHGYQFSIESIGGRAYVDWGVLARYANRGYLAVAVSLPGYGGSTGPADFAGPFSQRAVRAVIAALEQSRQAAPGKVMIEGTSLGAVTAALIAADEPDLAGLVLISGLYDPQPFLRNATSYAARAIRHVALRQVDGGLTALNSRSAMRVASRIDVPVLILGGDRDDRTAPDQARAFAAAINASGGHADLRIYRGVGHMIPVGLRDAEISAHVRRIFTSTRQVQARNPCPVYTMTPAGRPDDALTGTPCRSRSVRSGK